MVNQTAPTGPSGQTGQTGPSGRTGPTTQTEEQAQQDAQSHLQPPRGGTGSGVQAAAQRARDEARNRRDGHDDDRDRHKDGKGRGRDRAKWDLGDVVHVVSPDVPAGVEAAEAAERAPCWAGFIAGFIEVTDEQLDAGNQQQASVFVLNPTGAVTMTLNHDPKTQVQGSFHLPSEHKKRGKGHGDAEESTAADKSNA